MAVFQAVPVWTGCEWALLIDVSSRSERQRRRPLTLLQDSYADFLPPHILISSWHQRRCCFIIVFPPEEKIICHFLGNYQEIAEPENKQWLILTLNVSGWFNEPKTQNQVGSDWVFIKDVGLFSHQLKIKKNDFINTFIHWIYICSVCI